MITRIEIDGFKTFDRFSLDLRPFTAGGRPEELFRRTAKERGDRMAFAVEVLLEPGGTDPFGKSFDLRTQRVRFIATRSGTNDESSVIEIRQDGPGKRGRLSVQWSVSSLRSRVPAGRRRFGCGFGEGRGGARQRVGDGAALPFGRRRVVVVEDRRVEGAAHVPPDVEASMPSEGQGPGAAPD